ncbi:hypothetical protein VHN57_26125 [Sphingobium sp. WW5]|jgi:hypothetical protein|uniref:hypothetical protein n=1 Tax=Sphingobium TaxID=165695 RepID=UPI0009BE3D4F|nr:hypothetical protein [Sphingobium yanoikuyae]MDG2516129.1 hypothetical protein [Sphingobium yanoikuyae]RSU70329.1 hypothetical protein BRX37_23005 [Sphingomonas sp. S-NIH.Pt3_0716]HEV7434337.1 hypothetical protein [Pseudorhizobium sp.]
MTGKKSRSGPEALSAYVGDSTDHPHFRYVRYYWKNDGIRNGVSAAVLAKLTPAGHEAARHDLLVPTNAPGEYAQLSYLLERYDATHPAVEKTGYAQFTIDLSADRPLHVSWEDIRAWVLSYFVRELQLAVLMVLHVPYWAGSSNDPHVHLIVPARRLGANGFGLHARDVCCDNGCASALTSWQEFEKVGAV